MRRSSNMVGTAMDAKTHAIIKKRESRKQSIPNNAEVKK